MTTPTEQKSWEERFEEESPLAFAGRDWAKSFIAAEIERAREETIEACLKALPEARSFEQEEAKFRDHSLELRYEIVGYNTFRAESISNLIALHLNSITNLRYIGI